jgi:hypothetical protein
VGVVDWFGGCGGLVWWVWWIEGGVVDWYDGWVGEEGMMARTKLFSFFFSSHRLLWSVWL